MKILIAHADLSVNGGAEAYALAIRDRLLAAGHKVGVLDVNGHSAPAPTEDQIQPALLRLGRLPVLKQFTLWKYALVCRILPRLARQYDHVVLSFGEAPPLPRPSLRILHAPAVFSSHPTLLAVLGAKASTLPLRRIYAALCRRLARPTFEPTPNTKTLANSRWTANLASQHFPQPAPTVLYPRVMAPLLVNTPPVKRDPFHMVAIGRIVAGKRLEEAVNLLDALRAQDLPATLHIIGRADTPYARRFLQRHKDHPHLELSPNASATTLAQALARARLGIHPYRSEHFGIAIAEMIGAGVLPLVHDSGGVCELVPDLALRFRSETDLASKAASLMQATADECAARSLQLQQTPALKQALDFDTQLDHILKKALPK